MPALLSVLSGKISLSADKKESQTSEKALKLDSDKTYRIRVFPESYVRVTDEGKPQRAATLIYGFPHAVFDVKISNGEIIEAIIHASLCFVGISPPGKARTEIIEFSGTAWIDAKSPYETVVAFSRSEIFHRKIKKSVILKEDQQISISETAFDRVKPIEQRFLDAQKFMEQFGSFMMDAYYQIARDKADAQYDAYVKSLQSLVEQGLLSPHEFEKMKKDAAKSIESYKGFTEEQKKIAIAEQKTMVSTGLEQNAVERSINQEIPYNSFKIVLKWARREKKNKDQSKITLELAVTNTSKGTAFISWPEESRMKAEDNTIFELDDYKHETSYELGDSKTGYLYFIVPEPITKLKLELGKKSAPKAVHEIQI